MIQPHEIFPGAYLLDKDGQPFSVDAFFPIPSYKGGGYMVNGLYLLSDCSPIELTDKIVNQFDVISGLPEKLRIRMAASKTHSVIDCLNPNEELQRTKYLHRLQAFFIWNYTPITINEQQLREALNAN